MITCWQLCQEEQIVVIEYSVYSLPLIWGIEVLSIHQEEFEVEYLVQRQSSMQLDLQIKLLNKMVFLLVLTFKTRCQTVAECRIRGKLVLLPSLGSSCWPLFGAFPTPRREGWIVSLHELHMLSVAHASTGWGKMSYCLLQYKCLSFGLLSVFSDPGIWAILWLWAGGWRLRKKEEEYMLPKLHSSYSV